MDEQGLQKKVNLLPKVDEELHVRTIFEPVNVEARPAKTKPKIRSKLKWKEDVDLKEKTDESKHSITNSDKVIELHMKDKKETGQVKIATNEKSRKSRDKTDEQEQSILLIIVRKILEEILIWLIIIIILIIMRFRNS
ncbi:hypothetical protein QQG55_11465 [Brugia pahangi]